MDMRAFPALLVKINCLKGVKVLLILKWLIRCFIQAEPDKRKNKHI